MILFNISDVSSAWLFVILIGILILIFASIPTVISYFVYRWLSKKGYKNIGILIIVFAVVFTIFLVYTAIYPTNGFYKKEFSENTKLEFPKSGNILVKGASYPDIHGDYSSAAIFQVDSCEFINLINGIRANRNFKLDTISFIFGREIKYKEMDFDSKKFVLNYYWNLTASKTYYFNVAFDTTNKLVAFDRVTW